MSKKANIDFLEFDTSLGISYSEFASKKLGRNYWVVERGMTFNLDRYKSQKVYVPAGYLTDGASVPQPLWGFIPPWGEYGQACVVHDFLCEYLKVWVNGKYVNIDRERCDSILNLGMKVLKVPYLKREVIYRAVCLYRRLNTINNQPTFDKFKYDVEQELLKHYELTGQWK